MKTITGGFSTAGGGGKELAGMAIGVGDKAVDSEPTLSKEEDSMQKQIVKLLAEGKADKDIRSMTGCSDGQLQVIKLYLGDIKDKVRVEEEKAIVVEEESETEEEVDEAPTKVWDPFETKEEKKKKEARKVKLVPAVWDPLSPDKPKFIEVPIEEEEVPVESEGDGVVDEAEVAEESVEKAKPERTKGEIVTELLKSTKLSHNKIAEKTGASLSYIGKIKAKLRE